MENEERSIKKPTVSDGGGLKRFRLKLTPLEYLSRSLNRLYEFVEKTNAEYRNDYGRNRDKLVEVNAFGIDLRMSNGENNAKPYIVLTAYHAGLEEFLVNVEITISVTDYGIVYIKERTMSANGGNDGNNPMVSAYVTRFVGEVSKKFSDIYKTYRSMVSGERERKEESK